MPLLSIRCNDRLKKACAISHDNKYYIFFLIMECLSYPDREKRVFLNKVSIISEKKNIIYLRLLLLLLNANKIVYGYLHRQIQKLLHN